MRGPLLWMMTWGVAGVLSVASASAQSTRCVALDIYLRGDQSEDLRVHQMLSDLVLRRPGVTVSVHDLEGPGAEACASVWD